MLIKSITKNAMDKKFSIRQFPSPEHPYIAFPQKNLAVLDISRFTFCKVDYVDSKELCKEFFSKNPRLLWKWVGGSRSHSEFCFVLENHPKIALNQYLYFGVVYHVYSVCIYIYIYIDKIC